MFVNQKNVELLAPAGTWAAFEAAIDAGADAVYLGGKHFNMRVHKNDFNFDDAQLKEAINYAHAHNVKLYITLNNLISEEELPALKDYLIYLNEIKPDALLVQDFAVIKLIKELKIEIPIHASIMMNIHNSDAVKKLQWYGITRVVLSRELSLSEVKLIGLETEIETEYFIHGDMCFSESGQCIHSGVLFGQSGNRGRCLKPCRWSWELIDEETGEVLNKSSYKLALKDMCMYRHLPELINAGVYSFKIEGRMRPPEFIHRIVSVYRRAIDKYFADPTGYQIDENDWKELFDNRARDFTTTCAFGNLTSKDIGITGEREPRFFSKAVVEPSLDDKSAAEIFNSEEPIKFDGTKPILSVRVAAIESARAAIDNGADVVYVGGEAFRPLKPWKLQEYINIIDYAHSQNKKVILNTPRTTYRRECEELGDFFELIPYDTFVDGVMVSNLGSLRIINGSTLIIRGFSERRDTLPVQTDLSFNLFNHKAAEFLKNSGVTMAAASLELSYTQLKSLIENSTLPIEVVVHGSYESMICDHNLPKMYLDIDEFNNPEQFDRHYALKDEAGEIHPIRIDQYGRNHIYFAKDLCLYPYLKYFMGAASLRIEAQLYQPELVADIVKQYRFAIDSILNNQSPPEFRIPNSEFRIGIGVYRFRQSKNSIS